MNYGIAISNKQLLATGTFITLSKNTKPGVMAESIKTKGFLEKLEFFVEKKE